MTINQTRARRDTGRQISTEQMAAAVRVLQHCQARPTLPAQEAPALGAPVDRSALSAAKQGGA